MKNKICRGLLIFMTCFILSFFTIGCNLTSISARYEEYTVARKDIEVVVKSTGSFSNFQLTLYLTPPTNGIVTYISPSVDELTLDSVLCKVGNSEFKLENLVQNSDKNMLQGIVHAYTNLGDLTGSFSRSSLSVGAEVQEGLKYTIGTVTVNALYFVFMVDEKNIFNVISNSENGALVSDKVIKIFPNAFPDQNKPIMGKIAYLSNRPTSSGGMVYYAVGAYLDYEKTVDTSLIKKLMAGMTASVDIIVRDTSSRTEKPLTIPLEAILYDPSGNRVVVKKGYDKSSLASSIDLKVNKILSKTEYNKVKDWLIPIEVNTQYKNLTDIEVTAGLKEEDKILIFRSSAVSIS